MKTRRSQRRITSRSGECARFVICALCKSHGLSFFLYLSWLARRPCGGISVALLEQTLLWMLDKLGAEEQEGARADVRP